MVDRYTYACILVDMQTTRRRAPEWQACTDCGEETAHGPTAWFFEGTSLAAEAAKCPECCDERAAKVIQRDVWRAIEAGAL